MNNETKYEHYWHVWYMGVEPRRSIAYKGATAEEAVTRCVERELESDVFTLSESGGSRYIAQRVGFDTLEEYVVSFCKEDDILDIAPSGRRGPADEVVSPTHVSLDSKSWPKDVDFHLWNVWCLGRLPDLNIVYYARDARDAAVLHAEQNYLKRLQVNQGPVYVQRDPVVYATQRVDSDTPQPIKVRGYQVFGTEGYYHEGDMPAITPIDRALMI